MTRKNKARAGIIAGAALAAMAVAGIAGSTIANAADSSTSSSSSASSSADKKTHVAEEALTGATAESVKAAVLAKYPGATIDKMEKDSDGTSVYEAHITKTDGTKAKVLLDSSFAITGEDAHVKGEHGPDGAKGDTDGQGGKHGKGGHGHHGGRQGASSAQSNSGSNA